MNIYRVRRAESRKSFYSRDGDDSSRDGLCPISQQTKKR